MAQGLENEIRSIEARIQEWEKESGGNSLQELQEVSRRLAQIFTSRLQNEGGSFLSPNWTSLRETLAPYQEMLQINGSQEALVNMFGSILNEALYGNIVLIYQRVSDFLDRCYIDFVNNDRLPSLLHIIQKSAYDWDKAFCHGSLHKHIKSKRRDKHQKHTNHSDALSDEKSDGTLKGYISESTDTKIENLTQALIKIMFPEEGNSIYLPLSSFVMMTFGSTIKKWVYLFICDFLKTSLSSLFSQNLRKKILLHLASRRLYHKQGNKHGQKEIFVPPLSEDSLDQVVVAVKMLCEIFSPIEWKRYLILLPVREAASSLYLSSLKKYADKQSRDSDLFQGMISGLYLVLQEYSKSEKDEIVLDDIVIDSFVKWVESPPFLEALVSVSLPFAQGSMFEALDSSGVASKGFSPGLLAVGFSSQVAKKAAKIAASILAWDENASKLARKSSRYFLSDACSECMAELLLSIAAYTKK